MNTETSEEKIVLQQDLAQDLKAPTTMWNEVLVFIHGITPDPKPGSHTQDYQDLYKNIANALERIPDPENRKPKFPVPLIGVEWGWQSSSYPTTNDEYLAMAELALSDQAFRRELGVQNLDFTLNPFRMLRPMVRRLIFYGFADLMYYVSRDGEQAIRNHVFKYIADQVRELGSMVSGANLSLTFITHSAGTLIVHDLLYHLFRGQELPSEIKEVNEVLRELVHTNRLRVRRLYTMGSPLAPLMFRSDSLIAKMRDQQVLLPQNIGFVPHQDLAGPRWINIWDKDDVAAYPVSFLYENGNKWLEDKYIDVSDSVLTAHNKYWQSDKVAKYIAETL